MWAVDLDSINANYSDFCSSLSEDEKLRRDKLVFERDKRRFSLSREIQRRILAGYLNLHPDQIIYSYNKFGKPMLSTGSGCEFNVSHSDGVILLAVSKLYRVGIDIEKIKEIEDFLAIASAYFSDSEIEQLNNLPDAVKLEAFFTCWTRKEAFIKAVGEGLSFPLKDFSVTLGPDRDPAVTHIKSDVSQIDKWALFDISPAADFKAALVAEDFNEKIFCRQFISN